MYYTVELLLSGLIGKACNPDMQKIRITEFFFENRLHWKFAVETNSTNGYFRLFNYLPTSNKLIRNSL